MPFKHDMELLAGSALRSQGEEVESVTFASIVTANARATVALSQRIEALAAVIISPGIEWEWIEDATGRQGIIPKKERQMKIYLAARYSRREELLELRGRTLEIGA